MDLTPLFIDVVKASRTLISLEPSAIDKILMEISGEAVRNSGFILDENIKDLSLMEKRDPKYDRLLLTPERIKGIAASMENVARMPTPLGRILNKHKRPDGLEISKVSVPFGVVGVIYEARPNVTFEVFSLCFKSGNACILKGGSDAINTNTAIAGIIKEVLVNNGIDNNILTLLSSGHDETKQLLTARNYVDLIIPRGSRGLIDFVRESSTIPVIETGAGICHTYFDESGDREKGRLIIHNAKTRRVSVCNALDCLIIHEGRLDDLYYLVELCSGSSVIIFADDKGYQALDGKYPSGLLRRASPESFGTEYLSYKMAIKTAVSFEEALAHIEKYGSKHSEAIITEDPERKRGFFSLVDASSVYSNASTAFTDGAEFGLGAEIGISTQKLHARGPMGLEEITTYKWIIDGDGQIRK
jgi:glutamate-5-semialdehyde dehydrogenase